MTCPMSVSPKSSRHCRMRCTSRVIVTLTTGRQAISSSPTTTPCYMVGSPTPADAGVTCDASTSSVIHRWRIRFCEEAEHVTCAEKLSFLTVRSRMGRPDQGAPMIENLYGEARGTDSEEPGDPSEIGRA